MRWPITLLLLVLGACVATLPVSRSPLVDAVLRVAAQPAATAGQMEIHIGPAQTADAWAVASGVHLVLADDQPVFLPFTKVSRQQGRLVARCQDHPDHQVVVVINRPAKGQLDVQIEDRVQLRSEVRELTLAYDVAGLGPPDRTYVPHLHPEPDHVAGDRAFRAPLLYLQSGSRALCLTPDLSSLAAERRLPQALELDLDPARLRHGLVAHGMTSEVSFGGRRGSTWFSRRRGRPIEAQGESLRFAHRLQVIHNADGDTLARMFHRLWAEQAEPELRNTSHPLHTRTLDEAIAGFFDQVLKSRWTELRTGGFLNTGILAAGDQKDAWFSAFHQTLRTAYGLNLFLKRTSQLEPQEKVGRMLDLALSAPRRGGLFPSVLVVRKSDGTMRWEPDSARAGFATHYHALDTASTGYWMLRLSQEFPDRREQVLQACQETARFLMRNQGQNGAIPSFYDSTYVAPKRDALCTDSAETAAVALFLAEYGNVAADKDALAASRKALDFLWQEVLPTDRWSDYESYLSRGARGNRDPRSGVSRQGSVGMIYTALAALRLFEITGDEPLAQLATRALDALCRFQQVWSPSYLRSAVLGGFGAVNSDARWNDARNALAAAAFLEGYRLLGEEQFLRRGVAGLRAAFATAAYEFREADGTQGPVASPHWGMGAAATVAEIYRRHLGQGIVDLRGPSAQAIDSFWFTDLTVENNTVSFGMLTEAVFEQPLRICFRGLTEDTDTLTVAVNGRLLGEFAATELEQGIAISPSRVPRLSFGPPPEIRSRLPWRPRAGIDGPPGADWRAYIEVRTPRRSEQIPLALSPAGDLLLATESFLPGPDLGLGDEIQARLVYEVSGQTLFEPRREYRSIKITEFDAIDPGEGDEVELVEASSSRSERFPNGLEDGRSILGRDALRYDIPVPPEATNLEIRVRIFGELRIHAGNRLIHEDEAKDKVPARSRELRFQLADRRLWQTGRVRLAFQTADPDTRTPCHIALIRYRASGEAPVTAGLGKSEVVREPDQALHILVQPVALADRPLNAGREALNQLFFGGPEYRLTPEPESRTTAGSVSRLVTMFSGGRTSLKGDVLALARWPHLVADLQNPESRKWQADARTALGAAPGNRTINALILVTGGQDVVQEPPAMVDGVPVLFLPEREPDGSFLASGRVLGALLTACYGAQPLASLEQGRFGDLALMAQVRRHVPPPLIGLNMVRTGWSDLVLVSPRQDGLLQIPPLLEGRTSYVLEPGPLADRGRLHLEARAGRSPQEGNGLLAYWEFHDLHPYLRNLEGHSCTPHLLRLSAQAPVLARVRTTTPQGEHLWELRDLGPRRDGSMGVRVRFLPQDLLAKLRYRGGGKVEQTSRGLSLEPRPMVGDQIEAQVPAPAELTRIVGLVRAVTGEPQLTCGNDEQELLRADLVAADGGSSFQFDLPGGSKSQSLWLRVTNRRGTPAQITIGHLLAVPRSANAQRVRPAGIATAASTRLMDGGIYGHTIALPVSERAEQRLRVPVVLPDGPAALRLICGLPASAAPKASARLSIELTDKTGRDRHVLLPAHQLTRRKGRQYLFVALLELPETKKPRVAFLNVSWQGTVPLHLVALAIDHP
ncbi:MAG: prenyltransferase/squalene oxidase repeat-containing protein [Planctomycetota bacterium]|jgi:hypothetical protein